MLSLESVEAHRPSHEPGRLKMKLLRSQKGVALLLALVLGLISVVFLSGLMLLIGKGARLSGFERIYTSSVEAARGGADLIIKLLRREGVDVDDYDTVDWISVRDTVCLKSKLEYETQHWSCNDTCNVTSSNLNDIIECYDLRRTDFGDYNLYMKIVDTKLYRVGGKRNYLYTVHSLAVKKNPNENEKASEKAWITFIYKVEER